MLFWAVLALYIEQCSQWRNGTKNIKANRDIFYLSYNVLLVQEKIPTVVSRIQFQRMKGRCFGSGLQIQLEMWIRIGNPDPDPGRQKLSLPPPSKKINFLFFMCWIFSLGSLEASPLAWKAFMKALNIFFTKIFKFLVIINMDPDPASKNNADLDPRPCYVEGGF